MVNTELKIWGDTTTLADNPSLSVHLARIKQGYGCSIHRHAHRWNGFFIQSGVLAVRFYDNGPTMVSTRRVVLHEGDWESIPPGVWHRFECEEDCNLLEIYWVNPVDLDDIERYNEGSKLW